MADGDFEKQLYIERYKADREHELELDKLAGSLERTFLQVAGALNGGSATVFLSFLGSTADKVEASHELLITTFVLWLVGLTIAILAGAFAYGAQKHFMTDYRYRRHAGGLALFNDAYKRVSSIELPEGANGFAQRAKEESNAGDKAWRRATWLGVSSVVLFGLGSAFALATVLSASPVPHAVDSSSPAKTK